MKLHLFAGQESQARQTPLAGKVEPGLPPGDLPGEALVSLKGVVKRYAYRAVLSGVTCNLAAGKALVVLGPNGAGKTTLLRILATLTKPSEGTASVCGADVARDGGEVRRLIGYVGHQAGVYPDLTGLENLVFFARMYGLRDGPDRAWALLDTMGLKAKAGERARTYSRGQLQRLSLARALLHGPPLLLLDEPETGLDSDAALLLTELIQERRAAGLSTMFATHRLEWGLSEGDEALVLVGGRVRFAGPAAGIDTATLADIYAHGTRSRSVRTDWKRRALA